MRPIRHLTASAAILLATVTPPSLHAQQQPQAAQQLQAVRETPVTLGLVEGGNPQGYVQNSNDQGILFATVPGGQGRMITYAQIRGEGLEKAIRLDERADALNEARSHFAAARYEEAAEAFGNVARAYAIILHMPQNFASEALFYQMESLQRVGNFAELAQVAAFPQTATISTKLSERYHRRFEFLKLWGLLGGERFEDLRSALEQYEEPVLGDARLLNAPNFKKLPPAELVQLAFLRARCFAAEGNELAALDDYYRAFTLTYGSNLLVTQLAMEAAMEIHAADPRVAREDRSAIAQLQSLAYLYSLRFGVESLPTGLANFAEAPAVAAPSPVAAEAAAEAAAEETEPDEEKEEDEDKEEGTEEEA